MKYIENIAQRVRAAENRAAVIYAKPDGRLYKWIKWLYKISLTVTLLMSLLYIGGRASRLYELDALDMEIMSTADIATVKNSILIVGIVAVLWIAAMIVLKWKQEIISAILTVIPGVISSASLISASENTSEFNSGINADFWLRHFIPLALAAFFIVWLVIIRLRADLRFKTAYNNMVNRIYQQYSSDDITEEEWENFLKDYDPRAEEEKRRRNKKKQSEYKNVITAEEE